MQRVQQRRCTGSYRLGSKPGLLRKRNEFAQSVFTHEGRACRDKGVLYQFSPSYFNLPRIYVHFWSGLSVACSEPNFVRPLCPASHHFPWPVTAATVRGGGGRPMAGGLLHLRKQAQDEKCRRVYGGKIHVV